MKAHTEGTMELDIFMLVLNTSKMPCGSQFSINLQDLLPPPAWSWPRPEDVGGHPGEGHLLEGRWEVGGRRLEQFSRPATGRSTVRGFMSDGPTLHWPGRGPPLRPRGKPREEGGGGGGRAGGRAGRRDRSRPASWLAEGGAAPPSPASHSSPPPHFSSSPWSRRGTCPPGVLCPAPAADCQLCVLPNWSDPPYIESDAAQEFPFLS